MNWAYVSGFFDAEGSVGFYERTVRSPVVILISNTNENVIQEIKNFIDAGSIYERHLGNLGNKHFGKKPVYVIQISSMEDVKRFLKNIAKFSIVKKDKVSRGLRELGYPNLKIKPEINWSYVAGFFDGDGSISFSKTQRQWLITIINKNKEVLSQIQKFIKFGKIYSYDVNRLQIHMMNIPLFINNILDESIVHKSKLIKSFDELKDREWYPNYKLKKFSKEELKLLLEKMYYKDKLSIRKIAQGFGVTYNAIFRYFDEFKIGRRNYSESQKLVTHHKHTEKTKKKISETRKNNWMNHEYKNKMLKILEKARKSKKQ
jgi:predicted DNA-binding protein YlxM (UPF0122 family)